MQTIQNIQAFPNGTPIDSVQVRISKVYERKVFTEGKYGPTSVQGAMVEDASGAKIKIKVWGHPDIASMEGNEVVIHASQKGSGLKVVHDSYKTKTGEQRNDIILEVSKHGLFQHVEVYHAANPGQPKAAPAPVQTSIPSVTPSVVPAPAVPSAFPPIRGEQAGAAVNKAIDLLVAIGYAGEALKRGTLEDDVVKIGAQIVKAGLRLQKGEQILPDVEKPVKAKETGKADVPAEDNDKSEIPF